MDEEKPYQTTAEQVPASRTQTQESYTDMSVGRYIATRIPSLKPPMDKAPNPFRLLAMLNREQWLFFLVGFIGWTWDAFDFFTVSLTLTDLAKQFGKTNADISWGITLVLMFRSVGAITFGIAADRYGRKWPFILNNVLFIVLELGTGFCNTYRQFLAVRALYGIAMGGLYGNAAATALEDCPSEARGIISGMLQQGYAFGYLLATAFARALVDTTSHGWRPVSYHIPSYRIQHLTNHSSSGLVPAHQCSSLFSVYSFRKLASSAKEKLCAKLGNTLPAHSFAKGKSRLSDTGFSSPTSSASWLASTSCRTAAKICIRPCSRTS